MKHFFLFVLAVLLTFSSACAVKKTTPPSPAVTIITTSPAITAAPAPARTLYGFFPTPPDVTTQSIIDNYKVIGEHADVVLFQQNIPWADFAAGIDVESAAIKDIKNQYTLAKQNGLEVILVVDPLNGLNRREFFGLPAGWEHNFASPQVRAAYTNYTLRVLREFHPDYLGLASEINTYADAAPDDFVHFMSLYETVYDLVKAESPATKVFVTFQWEEMNNLIPGLNGRERYDIDWRMIEQFEPRLDIWAISSYPFAVGLAGKDIPADYYAPLMARTGKPLAVAEGGYTTETVGAFTGTPQDQVAYINAVHAQIGGERLAFWINLIITDFSVESFAEIMNRQGLGNDVATLTYFAHLGFRESDGTPKPALAVWDSFRKAK